MYTENITGTVKTGSLNLNIDFDELACELSSNLDANSYFLIGDQFKSGVTSIRKTAKSGYTEANVQ